VIIRVCLATALLVMPITATAQGNPGPFGQLFGRAPASTGQEQTLVEVRSDLSGMYDTMLMAPEGERLDRTQSGAIAGASAGLIVDHTSERFDAGLRGGVAHDGEVGTELSEASFSVSYRALPVFRPLP